MTDKTFEKAKKILSDIEHIRQLRSWAYHNPYIKKNKDDYDYMYLSWADNESKELQNTIIKWCDEEIKKLQSKFNEL